MKKKIKVHAVKKVKKSPNHGNAVCTSYVQVISVISVLAIIFMITLKMATSANVLGASTQINQGPCNGHIFCK